MSTVTPRKNHETLRFAERIGEVIIIGMMLLLFAFFVYHQTANTGFFTEKFGTLEMLCLYVPLLLALIPPAIRAFTGRRNPARLFDVMTSLVQTAGALWLVSVFPFNYAHLADALPFATRFILAWVTDDLGRLVLILQIIVGPATAMFAMAKYLAVRENEAELTLRQRPS